MRFELSEYLEHHVCGVKRYITNDVMGLVSDSSGPIAPHAQEAEIFSRFTQPVVARSDFNQRFVSSCNTPQPLIDSKIPIINPEIALYLVYVSVLVATSAALRRDLIQISGCVHQLARLIHELSETRTKRN